jgi:hypothetical protein
MLIKRPRTLLVLSALLCLLAVSPAWQTSVVSAQLGFPPNVVPIADYMAER